MHNFVYLAQRRSQEFSCEPNFGRAGERALRSPLAAPLIQSSRTKRLLFEKIYIYIYIYIYILALETSSVRSVPMVSAQNSQHQFLIGLCILLLMFKLTRTYRTVAGT